jgi:predicted RND superfamily exporter protein
VPSAFCAPGIYRFVERERSAAARTALVASTVKAALTVVLGALLVAGCGSLLLTSWPPAAQFAVLAVIAINMLLLRRFCGALQRCANASLHELEALSPDGHR